MPKLTKEEQIEITEELQGLLLEDFRQMLKGEKEMSATDRATLVKLLKENGWDLDPMNKKTTVRDKLTDRIDPADLDDDDVIPMARRA